MDVCRVRGYDRLMSGPARRRGNHTIAEWIAQPEDRYLELIDGEFVEKASPDVGHSSAQGGVVQIVGVPFHRRGGPGGPGGWWIFMEVDIALGENGFRPDLSGWRRDRVPVMPREHPVTVRPDWICEVLSDSNASPDTVLKMRRYHQAGVPHYWIVDPMTETLAVYRNSPEGFTQVLLAQRRETVRAEPFDAIEIRVGLLFGDDPDDPPQA